VRAGELRAANAELAAQAAQAQRLRHDAAQLKAELEAVRAEDAAEIARLWQRVNSLGGASHGATD
jgi:multidrug resistance efflux pump